MTTPTRAPVEDYLTEDSPILGQNFFVLSYLLPDETKGGRIPMIKVRGTYKTIEDCQRRIDTLKHSDTYFNMFIAEVGKWGGLFDNESLLSRDDIDTTYRNETMNTMMKEYKANKDRGDTEFEERKNKMREGGSIETKEEILERKEALEAQIEDLRNKLDSALEIHQKTVDNISKLD
jgi:hypothetical protein